MTYALLAELPDSLLKLLALGGLVAVLSLALLAYQLWGVFRGVRGLWRQLRGALLQGALLPPRVPRLGGDPPLRLPPGVDAAPTLARPHLWLRLSVTLLALALIPGFGWYFDILPHPDLGSIRVTLWVFISVALLWYIVIALTWRVTFDDQGLTVAWLGQPGRRQEWRDLVLIEGDGPFACMLHFSRGPSLMILRPLVGGERLFQIAQGHLFRGSHARAARG